MHKRTIKTDKEHPDVDALEKALAGLKEVRIETFNVISIGQFTFSLRSSPTSMRTSARLRARCIYSRYSARSRSARHTWFHRTESKRVFTSSPTLQSHWISFSFVCKVDVCELGGSDKLCEKGAELTLFLFTDVLEVAKRRKAGGLSRGGSGLDHLTRSPGIGVVDDEELSHGPALAATR